MNFSKLAAWFAAFFFLLPGLALATEFAGTYHSPKITLQLTASAGGYTGTLTIDGAAYPVTAKENAGALAGTFNSEGAPFAFDAQLAGTTLTLHSGGNAFELKRDTPQQAAPANPLAKIHPDPATAPAPGNDLPTGDAAVAALKDLGPPQVDLKRDWLIINYVDGDNNIELDAAEQIKEMEQGLPDSGVEVIVLYGRPAKVLENGEKNHSVVYQIRKSQHPDSLDSKVLKNLGQINMADSKYLGDFIEGALKAFPARQHALITWDHGGTWQGLLQDEHAEGKPDNSDLMDMPRFRTGVINGMKAAGLKKWDIITFDMCLMGQLEVAAQVHDLTDVMLASEAIEPGPGMPYIPILQTFGKGTLGGRRIGSDIVLAFDKYHREHGVVSTTFSAMDMTAFDDVNAKLNALVDKLLPAMPNGWSALAKSCFYGEQYAEGRDDFRHGEYAYQSVDLLDLLKKTRSAMANFPAEAEYKELVLAMDRFVIASVNSNRRRLSNGVAIYAPVIKEAYNPRYPELIFAKVSHWPKLIEALHAEEAKHNAAPTFGKIELVDFKGNPATAVKPMGGFATSIEVNGNNMVWVRDMVGVRDAALGGVKVFGESFVVDEHFLEKIQKGVENFSQDVDVIMPQLADGPNKLKQPNIGVNFLGANGDKTFQVYIDASDLSNPQLFTVQAWIEHPSLGNKPAWGIMHCDANSLAVNSITLTETNAEGAAVVREIKELPADAKITPAFKVIKDDGTLDWAAGEPVTWNKGIYFTMDLMAAGDYEEVLTAETMTGAQTTARLRFKVEADENLRKSRDTWRDFKSETMVGTWTWEIAGKPMQLTMDVAATDTPFVYNVNLHTKDKEGKEKTNAATLILELHDQPFYRLTIFSDLEQERPEVSLGAVTWAPENGKGRVRTHALGYEVNIDWIQKPGEGVAPAPAPEPAPAPLVKDQDPEGWRRISDANHVLSIAVPPSFVTHPQMLLNGKKVYPGFDAVVRNPDLLSAIEIIRFDGENDAGKVVDTMTQTMQNRGMTAKVGEMKKNKLGGVDCMSVGVLSTARDGTAFVATVNLFTTPKGIIVVDFILRPENVQATLPTLEKIAATVKLAN